MTVGSIVNGAFRLIREHPAAVAIWGAIYLLFNLGLFALMLPSLGTYFSAVQSGAMPPAAMGSFVGTIWAYDLVLLVVMVVLFGAAFRAVFWPEQSGLAYLRLGMDELRLLGLALLFGIVSFVAMFAVGMVAGIVGALLAVAVGAHSGGGAVALVLILMVLIWAVAIYFEVRLSLAFPLTMLRRKFVVGEAWRLTRGRFWTLFGAYLVLFLIMAVLSVIVFSFSMGPYFSALMHSAGNPQAASGAAMLQMQQMMHPGPLMILTLILGGAIGAIGIGLAGGALATATRELAPFQERIDDDYAPRNPAQIV